jgi:nucleoside-diphosphate-sugar epimerase
MARVVVTGGAGFLGSHLCEAMMDRGDQVVAVDNLVSGSRENLTGLLARPGFSFVEADVSDGLDVDGPVDVVAHLASPASPNPLSSRGYLAHPIATLRVGSEGTRHALELARRHGATMLVTSTSEVYGDPLVHPQPESYWGHVNPIGPRSVYDEAKRYAEALTMAYHRQYGTDIRIVRVFNTYGPRMAVDDGRVVSNFICQALQGKPITVFGEGAQTRSFCFVDDEIRGLLALLDHDVTGPINIGSDGEFTILQLARLIIEITGSPSEIVYERLPEDDPTQRQPDLTLARTQLGWSPTIDLADGLRRTIPFFQSALGL